MVRSAAPDGTPRRRQRTSNQPVRIRRYRVRGCRTLWHARNAAVAGVDGLVPLIAEPVAIQAVAIRSLSWPRYVNSSMVRSRWQDASQGHELSIEMLGADLGYMGTAFLASSESDAPPEHNRRSLMLTSTASTLPMRRRNEGKLNSEPPQDTGHIAADGSVHGPAGSM
jgi:hypothetical protein